MKKKALALLLALCMVISMLPVSVFAAPVSESAAPVTAATVGELTPAAIEPNAKSYSVKLTGEGNGTVELLVSSPAAEGSEVYFLADPNDGYLAYIYCDGLDPEELVYVGADVYGFIMPANKVTLKVEFVAAEGSSHRIKLYSGDGGQAELDRTSAKENESVYLAVLPDNQNGFDPTQHVFATSGLLYYLYMDEETGIHIYELFMPDEDVNVFVEYCKSGPFRVNAFLTSGDQSATVKIEPQSARFLDTVTVTIVPAEGYELTRVQAVSWAGDLVSDLTPIGNNQYTFTMHPADVDLYINVDPIPEPPSVHSITWEVTPAHAGHITLSHTTAYPGETVTVTFHATPGYYRQMTSTNASSLDHVSGETYTFVMPNYDVDITAEYRPYFNYARVSVENNGLGGTATLSKDGGIPGAKITLTCVPDEGYRVAQITGVDDLTDNGDNTYTFAMPGGVDVDVRVLFLRHDNPFLDINETQFFYDSVLWAVEKGITNGLDDTHFGPFGVCNRAQVVTFLWRYAGSPEPTTADCPFTDVQKGSWYEKPVLWAVEKGITNGVSATEFGANLPCNRAQVVTFLWRFLRQPVPGLSEHPFTDVQEKSWYEQPVLWAVENGITNGATTTTFNPNGECQRAQVVTFLYRTAQLPPAVYALHTQFDAAMGSVTLSHTEAAAGETITAAVVPNEGYLIESVSCLGGTEVTQVSDGAYTFVMPEGEETFAVTFAPIPTEPEPTEPEPTEPEPTEPEPTEPVKTYELDLRTNGNGEVAYVDNQRTAAPGESIFFYAVPHPGYELTNVGIFNPNNEINVDLIQLYEHGNDLYELVMIDHDIIMTCYFTPIG